MSEQEIKLKDIPISIYSFKQNIQNHILAYVECNCGFKTILASPFCPKCKQVRSKNTKWQQVNSPGEIHSYCVTYVGAPELKDITPYIAIIVDFGDGLKMSSILYEDFDPRSPPDDLIGQKVKHDFLKRPDGTSILIMRKA